MSEEVFKLPGRDEMLQKLLKISDEPHLVQHLYPRLLESAGEERVAIGIVMQLQLAIHDYTGGMPPAMQKVLNLYMPRFIEALAPNEAAANGAKSDWEKILESMKAAT